MAGSTYQTSECKPHFSTLLKTATKFDKKEPSIEFGKSWKELVLPVAAIRIKLHDGAISSIKNVAADDIPRLTKLDQFSASDRTFIFQLLDGEWITKVDTHAGRDYIHAIRFHTNLRVSVWFGSAKGDVRGIKAPEGFVIRSLYGAWGRKLRELGAVFVPSNATNSSTESDEPTTKSGLVVDLKVASDDYRAPFSSTTLDIGAVIVSVDPDIKWIRVISHHHVDQLKNLLNGIYPGDHEQWIDLLNGEQIIKMEVLDDGEVVVGLRFTTTLRTTPWIGWAPDTDYTESVYECEPGTVICGVHGARGREGISQLGCIVTKPTESNEEAAVPALGDTGSTSDDETGSSEAEEAWNVINDEEDSGSDDGESEDSVSVEA